VGLVCAAIGSTPSEAWTSYEALARDAELKASSDRKLEILQNYPKYKSDYAAAFQAWCQKYGREDRPDPEVARTFASFTEKSGWTHVKLPGKLTGGNLPATGAVWVVRTFNFNASYAGKPMPLSMGKPTGFDALWWNGENIGEKTLENQRGHGEGRQYTIPGAKVKEGTNTLALRLYSPIDDLAIEGKLTHAGEWAAKAEFALPPMSEDALKEAPAPLANLPDAKKTSGLLFNSYINPLIPYTIKGAIWYQGENNAERAAQYRTAFPLLINDWRARWGQGDFPFYFCQLANHDPKRPVPGDHPWAELREAQSSALSLPNTGQAVLIDAGEAGDIHPRDKATAGRRLAAIALARDYGKGTPFSGPVYASSAREGNAIRVRFNHADGGLVAQPLPAEVWLESASNRKVPLVRNRPESQLEGFAIAGKDGKWAWADARVDGDSVLVSAPEVSLPEHVRYAWATNPTCNLANGAGFPAAPFRTDKFPGLTDGAKY
jgi:sialate O-acetylesterase